MTSLDPIEAVRRLEAEMFVARTFDAHEAVGHIVRSALRCGATEVTASVVGGWFCVSSPTDWLIEDGRSVAEAAFQRIVSYRAGGDNSMRPEVLLTAFAKDVVTATADQFRVVAGSADDLPDRFEAPVGGRAIGFTFHPGSDDPPEG